MDTSSPDPLAGSGIAYEATQPTTQTQPEPKAEVTPESLQTSNDPLAGSGIEYSKSLSTTYRQVMDSPASKNAQVLKLSQQSGMSPSQVAQNPDDVEKAVSAPTPEYLDNLNQHSPVTAQWLGEQNQNTPNIAAVHDDVPANVAHESAFKDFEKASGEAGASFLKYVVMGGELMQSGPGRLPWDTETTRGWVDALKAHADAISSPDLNADAINEAKNGNFKPLEAQVVTTIPNLIKFAALYADPFVGAAATFSETSGQALEKSQKSGISDTSAQVSSLAKGTVTAGVTALTFGLLGKLYGPLAEKIGGASAKIVIGNAVKAKLATDAAFVGQGQATLLANAITDKVTGEDPNAFDNYAKKAIDEGTLDLVQGQVATLPGLGLTVLAKSAEGIKATPKVETNPGEAQQTYHEQVANAGKEFFLKALDTAKARKLSADNPIMAKDIDDKLGRQYGAQEVHIPVEQFQEMYQDKADEIAGKMGKDFKDSYEQAKATGGTVHGPLSDLLTNKADIKPQELADHVKFDPTGKTVFEAKESKQEFEQAAKEKESDDAKALAEFEKMVKTGAEDVGGKVGQGSATQAKGITTVVKNMAQILNKPVSEILQLAKFSIQKERTMTQDFNKNYEEARGINTPADYVKRYGTKIYLEPPDESLVSGGLEDAKKRYQMAKDNVKNAGLKITNVESEGHTPASLAQSLFDAANDGEINKSSLPQEWWDEGHNGRPDATLDTILELINQSGSGVEALQKLNESMQEQGQRQPGFYDLPPEEEKNLFGNVVKKSKVDEVFNDKTLKPNLDAKQQDMFGAKETKPDQAQQEMFQSSWDKLQKSGDFERFKRKGNEIMAMKPAVKDPRTGRIWSDDEHRYAFNEALAEGAKVTWEDAGFLKADGTFVSREDAEKHFGIHDTDDLRNAQEHFQSGEAAKELLQSHRGRITISGLAGEPQGRDFNVYASAGGDQSTLFHEFAHAFLQIFRDHASQSDATPEARDIEDKLLKWFDVKSWEEVNDRHSEMFARGFEYRLWEGKSPSGLEKVFQKFAEWMRKIYPSSQVMGAYLKSVGAEMTDEMRGVYDRFIASSEEIEKATKEMGYNQEAPKGLSEEELQEWKSKQDTATQEAMNKLNTQKMEGLKQEAKLKVEEEKVVAEKQATDEVDKLPVFQAEKALEEFGYKNIKDLGQRYLDGKATPAEMGAIEHVALTYGYDPTNGPAELAYGLANSDYKKEVQDRVDAHMDKFTPKVFGNPSDIQIAAMGGEERSNALAYEAALFKNFVNEFKSNALKGEMEKAQGNKAVSSISDKKPEPLTKEEIAAKRRATFKQYQEDKAAAKTEAIDQMSKMKFKDARAVDTYVSNMKNAAKRAQHFAEKGDMDKAREWKLKQLLNHELSMQAVKNRDFITKATKGLQKMGKIEKKPLAMPFGHWYQIKNALESFGLKKPSLFQEAVLKKNAESMLRAGKENNQIADATGMTFNEDNKPSRETLQQFKSRINETNPQLAGRINLPTTMSMKDMTLGDLRATKNSLEAIYTHGKDANTIKWVGKELALNQYIESAIDQLHKRFGRQEGEKVVMPHDAGMNFPHPVTAAINGVLNADDAFLTYSAQFPRVIKDLDGGDKGPFNDLGDKMIAAGTEKTRLKQERLKAFEDVKNKYYTPKEWDDVMDKYVFAKTSVGKHFVTKAMLHAIYEYSGTKEGLTYLKTGIGYTDDDLLNLRNMLDKKDIDFIHEHNAKIVANKWPDIVKTEMEVNSVEPKPVDLLPVETKRGIRTGVYRPLEPDPKNNFVGRTLEDLLKTSRNQTDESAAWQPMRATTDKDFTKQRTNVKGISPNLSRAVWDRYYEKTENYLAYQPALKEINKVLSNKEFMQELHRAIGSGADLFGKQIKYVVSGSSVDEGFIGKTLANLRRLEIGASIGLRGTLFGLKLMTDALNVFSDKDGGTKFLSSQVKYGLNLGMNIPTKEGGVKNLTVYANPQMRDIIQKVSALSPDMREQATSYEYNAMEFSKLSFEHNVIGKILATANLPRVDKLVTQNMVSRWLGLNNFLAERNADASIRFPKWWETYNDELSKGSTKEQAIIQANKITDNLLGSAKMLYHTGPQRGGELEKQFTPVLSFATNQLGQFMQKGYRPLKSALFQGGKPGLIIKMAMLATGGALQFFVAPSMMKTSFNLATGKDKNVKDALKDVVKTTGSEAFQGIPFAGYLSHGLESKSLDFGLPIEQSIKANAVALHSLNLTHLGSMSEKDWDNELQAFSADTGFPKSADTIMMNFMDHLDHQDAWQWHKDLSVKRKLIGENTPGRAPRIKE